MAVVDIHAWAHLLGAHPLGLVVDHLRPKRPARALGGLSFVNGAPAFLGEQRTASTVLGVEETHLAPWVTANSILRAELVGRQAEHFGHALELLVGHEDRSVLAAAAPRSLASKASARRQIERARASIDHRQRHDVRRFGHVGAVAEPEPGGQAVFGSGEQQSPNPFFFGKLAHGNS